MEKSVLVDREGKILVITLNRPEKYNALSMEMRADLLDALLEAEKDPGARVVVITGKGKAFCSGGDIGSMRGDLAPGEGRERLRNIQKIVRVITGMDKLVIAAVNGPAVGAGCNLALACDLILAAEGARFGQPFGKIGLVPDMGGLYFLPRLVGLAKARELVFTWRIIEAGEAERIGLVNRVVPAEKLRAEVEELAGQLSRGPALANALTKAIINRSPQGTLDQVLEEEAAAQDICFRSADFKEGVRAFFEKRKPEFS